MVKDKPLAIAFIVFSNCNGFASPAKAIALFEPGLRSLLANSLACINVPFNIIPKLSVAGRHGDCRILSILRLFG
jgi:hypothetical protein